jgi:hypothetical protein
MGREERPSDRGPWTGKTYAALRRSTMESIPEGKMRDAARQRIERLDCINPDKKLAPCGPTTAPTPEVLDWQKKLARATVDDATYAKALAITLRELICANEAETIYILRGVMTSVWGASIFELNLLLLRELAGEAPALVDFVESKECPVAASLTEIDKSMLRSIREYTPEKSPSPPAPKGEK